VGKKSAALLGWGMNSRAASAPAAVGAFFLIAGRFWVHWRQAGAAHVHFWRSPAPATAECTQIGPFWLLLDGSRLAGAENRQRWLAWADLAPKARRNLVTALPRA
jgi:hypothetical protein